MKLKTKDIVITTLQRENREISRDELFKLSNISDKASYNLAISELQEDGDIILMHEIYSSTADAVERMVPELIKKGYQLVTCEELIQAKTGAKPKSGEQYVDAKTINNKTS